MPDTPVEPNAAQRHRLQTFGTLALVGPEGAILGNRGPQRRRLALLAVLAAAGEHGRSRDQLLLLFWPDATQARARHSLEQLLYAIRTAIDKLAFVGVDPVRLNADAISSDASEFNDAFQRGDLEAAVEIYRGPFLEGFHLGDALEFEQWLDAERAQFQRNYTEALERLAQQSGSAGDRAGAVRWNRMLSDADPVSSKYAMGLMRALMNEGDHGAALQHAERHEAAVTQELGTGVGPAVAELVAEVRSRAHTVPISPPRYPGAPRLKPATQITAAGEPGLAPVPAAVGDPDSHRTKTEPVTSRSRRRLVTFAAATAVAFLVAAGLGLRASRRETVTATASVPSIAVLPFANLGGSQPDGAVVDGLTEDLMAVLARIPKLRVVARTSSFAFRNSNIGVRRIADSLGVSNILEGSVQKSGTQLRVQVRLVDARDGSTRWSETYDRQIGDIFVVQSEIAAAIARELDLRLSDGTRTQITRGATPNIAAYELYLRGNDPTLLRSDSGARQALEYFRQAIALDPKYAAAYAGLSRMHLRSHSPARNEKSPLSRRGALALAEAAALKAVALDDSLGEAHYAMAIVRRNNFDFTAAEADVKRAIALSPANSRFREFLVQLLIHTERPGEGLLEARRANELDPLSPTATAEVAHALAANNRCDEAFAYLDRLKSIRPPLLRVRAIATECWVRRGMWPQAIAEMREAIKGDRRRGEDEYRNQSLLGFLLARSGRTEEARQILKTLLERSRESKGASFEVASVYAGLGEYDQAFSWFDRAVDDRSLWLWNLGMILDVLPRDGRLERLRSKIGIQKR